MSSYDRGATNLRQKKTIYMGVTSTILFAITTILFALLLMMKNMEETPVVQSITNTGAGAGPVANLQCPDCPVCPTLSPVEKPSAVRTMTKTSHGAAYYVNY